MFSTPRPTPATSRTKREIEASLAALRRDMGSPSVLVHNAVGGAWGTFQDIDPKILNRNFQVNTMALLHLARRLAPAMVERGSGAIVVTGNTSALRGRANFAGFAPTKAAQRILAEAMARDLGPKGVHVAYIVIDAVIDLAWTRERYPDATRQLLHQARGHRRRGLARPPAGPERLVVQCRNPPVRREMVSAMADLRIFSYLPNPRIWKATIAARLNGVDLEVRGAKPSELTRLAVGLRRQAALGRREGRLRFGARASAASASRAAA